MVLTYDVLSKIDVFRAYLLYYLMKESQIWGVDSSWDGGVVHTIWVTLTLTLTSGLISRSFVSVTYLLYYSYLPQMCLMLDQFLWGHSSGVCDITC